MSKPGSFFLKQDQQENWCWFDNVLTPMQCDSIIRDGKAGLSAGKVFDGKDPMIRASQTHFLHADSEWLWLFDIVAGVINHANDNFFGYDLTALSEGIQFTEYLGTGDHYTWHTDKGFAYAPRKLSITIQLSDPESYEGGDLELQFGPEPVPMKRSRGSAFIFPATMLHRVTPVTSGERYSLVAWVTGPPFR